MQRAFAESYQTVDSDVKVPAQEVDGAVGSF
jgi:hypothetical protein